MLTVAALSLVVFQGDRPDTQDLRIRPPAAPVHLFVTQELDTKMRYLKAEIGIEIDLEWDLELRFRAERETGQLEFDLHFEHISGVISSSLGGRTEFDSGDGKSEYAGMFSAKILQQKMLAGRTLKVVITPKGRVESLEGYAEVYRGSPLEEELRRGGELLTDESFRYDVQALFALLPESPLSSGSRWEATYPFIVFEDEVTFRPRFQRVESGPGTARWTFVTALDDQGQEVDASAPREFVSEADVKNASLRGESVISSQDGLPLRQSLEVVLEVVIPSPFGGESLPGVVKQHVEVRREEKALGDKPPAGGGDASGGKASDDR